MGISAPAAPTLIRVLEPPPGANINDLARAVGASPLTAHLMALRGISTVADALDFLAPRLDKVADPNLLPDAEAALDRICHAIKQGQTIFVHGDYDVDGITSAALYTRVIRRLGGEVIPFVPNRKDGYGVSPATIEIARRMGAELVLTCDCGVSAHDACNRARELGLDMVVTDHHTCPEALPCAFAVVDPMRSDSQYPYPELAGVGVAYKICQGLCARLGVKLDHLHGHFLDYVTIGTVADSAPLLGENRTYVYHGLRSVERSRKLGIRALLEAAGVGDRVSARTIGFQIGPRINAVGRLAEASLALDLMLTDDLVEARGIALKMCEHNDARRKIQDQVQAEAMEALTPEDLEAPVVVVAGKGWNRGLVGIVAGRLSDSFWKPVIVANTEDGMCKGSGRSIPGFSLAKAIRELGPDLVTGGGHAMAAGITFRADRLADVRARLGELALEWMTDEQRARRLDVEAVVDATTIDLEVASDIARLQPFGDSNPDPVLMSQDVRLTDIKTMGEGQAHFRAGVAGAARGVSVVGWGMGQWAADAGSSAACSICYNINVNEFNGERKVDLVLVQQPII